jgi:hypothetical protein
MEDENPVREAVTQQVEGKRSRVGRGSGAGTV